MRMVKFRLEIVMVIHHPIPTSIIHLHVSQIISHLTLAYKKRWAVVTVQSLGLMGRANPIETRTLKAAREHALRSIPSTVLNSLLAVMPNLSPRVSRPTNWSLSTTQFRRRHRHRDPLNWRIELEQQPSKTIKILFRYVYARGRSYQRFPSRNWCH